MQRPLRPGLGRSGAADACDPGRARLRPLFYTVRHTCQGLRATHVPRFRLQGQEQTRKRVPKSQGKFSQGKI